MTTVIRKIQTRSYCITVSCWVLLYDSDRHLHN